MTIHIPQELESSILAQVHSGHFASLDDAMTEAARLLLRQLEPGSEQSSPARPVTPGAPLGSIGAMRDAAAELDEVVALAMQRRQEPWRVIAGE